MVQNTCETAKTYIVFVKLLTFSHTGQSEHNTERLIVFKPAICAGGTAPDLFFVTYAALSVMKQSIC